MSARGPASRSSEDAPLVPLLVGLSFVTGSVDAISILRLGHVFVANMTGNIVYLGFALAGAKGFSIPVFLVSLAAFSLGAAVAGRILRVMVRRRRALGQVALAEAVLVGAAGALLIALGAGSAHYPAIVLLAVAMGAQNALAYRLAVPSLTTTVLTLTIVGLAADQPEIGHRGSLTRRRLAAVTAILAGAVVGGLLVLHASTPGALAAVCGLLAVVAAAGFRSGTASAPAAPAVAQPSADPTSKGKTFRGGS